MGAALRGLEHVNWCEKYQLRVEALPMVGHDIPDELMAGQCHKYTP